MLLSALSEAYVNVFQDRRTLGVQNILVTGSHSASILAVRQGCCDIAAIDCVSLALGIHHNSSFMDGVKVFGWTNPAPALPLVTHKHVTKHTLRSIRTGLAAMLESDKSDVVKARQDSLLVEIDMSDRIDTSSYEKAVNDHTIMANRIKSIISLTPNESILTPFKPC